MIFNVTGGASGSFTSLLVVVAKTGSTVSVTKGSTSKTGKENSGAWCFADLDAGTWTVEAMLSGETKTQTVTVASTGVTYLEILYDLTLYDSGNENLDVTGGWEMVKGHSSSFWTSTGTMTKNDTNIYLSASGTAQCVGARTANLIDVTNFSTLTFQVDSATNSVTTGHASSKYGLSANADYFAVDENTVASYMIKTVTSYSVTVTIDISGISGEYYIYFWAQGQEGKKATTTVSKVELSG